MNQIHGATKRIAPIIRTAGCKEEVDLWFTNFDIEYVKSSAKYSKVFF